MKNLRKFVLFSLFIYIPLILISVIISAYFYCNLIYLPKQLIPQICKQAGSQLQQKITIKNISISPDGKTNIRAIALYSKDTDTIIAQCDYIKIEPAFKVIFFTWKKNPKRFDIPLTILIEGISFSQLPVKVSGNAQVELTLKIEPDNLQNIDYNGKIYLKKFNISEVPFLKEISDLNGTILVAKNIISSSDIEGKINESSATLKFSVDDFLNPKLKISGELPPLSFDIDCSLSDNNLNISRILANYNQIKFKLSGLINDIQKDRNAELSAELNLNLEELDQLPLNVKEFLSTLAPSGTITSSAKINGALSDISNLKGTIELNSPGISILKYSIKDIALKAELNQGLLNVEKLSASVFETLLELQAKLDIKNTSLPFEANIKTGRLSLKAVMDTLKLQPKISADILADCTIKGYAANPNNINAEVNVTLEKFSYETFSFNNPVFLSAVILIENLKDIKISSLLIKDNTVNIKTSGLVKNLYSPVLDLTADITCQLDNLKTYPIALPENFALGGIINIPLNITGPALNPAEINAGFGINAKQLTLGQFELESIDLKGSLTNLKLAIPQINVGLYQGTLNAQVNIDFAQAQPPAFDLRAYIENLNIESFAKKTNLLSPDFRGTLFSEIDLKGKGFDPKKLDANTQANIRLENANIQGFPLEKVRLDAKTSCKNETIDILELKLLYKTIEINSKATLNSFLKNPIIEAQLSTDLDLADISKLPLEIKKTIDELMLSGKVAAQVNLRGPLEDWKSLDINAQINSKRAGIKNIIFEDFNLTSRFTNKILTLNADTDTYGGKISANAKADFLTENFTYQSDIQLKKVNIGSLIKESTIIAQPHQGILSFNAKLSGVGSSLNTLSGKADFQLTEAKLYGIEFLKAIGKISNIEFLEVFEVSQGSGDFEINNAMVSTQNTQLAGPSAITYIKGAVEIITQRFEDFIVTLALTPEAAQRTSSGVLENFFDYKDNIYQRDIHVKGTLTKPEIDQKKLIEDLAKQQAKLGLKKLIEQNIGLPPENSNTQSQQQPSAEEQLQKGVEKILEKGLKGLFGR